MQHFYDFRLAASATAATTQRDKGCNGLRSGREQRDTSFTCFQLNDTFPGCLPVVFIPFCFFFNFSISHSHFLLDLLVARAMRLISHYDWNVVFALCVTQTQTANGKNGRKMFWTAESWGGGWLGGEWCLSLTPRGVDGASLRSLVSHHQSLIPFIFSENNHFEATYGIRHDTTTERHGTGTGTTMFRICWQKHTTQGGRRGLGKGDSPEQGRTARGCLTWCPVQL